MAGTSPAMTRERHSPQLAEQRHQRFALFLFEIDFNKKKYDSLPKELQAILKYAAEAASTANFALALDQYSTDLQELKEKDKVNVIRTPTDIFTAQLKAWDVIVKKLEEEDPFFKKVWDSQKAWAKRVGYYGFLNGADNQQAYDHLYGKTA
jgi:TRAP-type mannitol/chloroaromatic compound transport system substrate-binding protein